MARHPELDVLIVTDLNEAREHRDKFEPRQIILAGRVERLLRSRVVRNCYVTRTVRFGQHWQLVLAYASEAVARDGGSIKLVEQWEREPTIYERLEALPGQNPTKSRDFGRGYSTGVRDAIEIVHEELDDE